MQAETVGGALSRDLGRQIEEVIKVDQTDEQSVYNEISEYVATDRIRDQYLSLLRPMAEAPADPDESVGVWISGFFGSGKSSFAKNLGYMLSNKLVLGHPASDLLKARLADERLSRLIDYINARIPTEVIMFDISVEAAVRRTTEKLSEVIYTVLLRELGYAEDHDIAELEIELEREGRLEAFEELCREEFDSPWTLVRKGAEKFNRASRLLHIMDPATYPSPDTWATSVKSRDITVRTLVERTFELAARRRPGKAVVFIIDEVGQYVASNLAKIDDLRALVEQYGKESKNRVKARRALAPVWIVVTSQEKLDEVAAAMDSTRVELARLQDRFRLKVDMKPTDVREIVARRVLAKTDEGACSLRRLFQEHQGQLNKACRLERSSRPCDVTEAEFVKFYPYLPHLMDLSIDIMSGIRNQFDGQRQLGGGTRTLIKQAYEMLVSDRTRVANRPLGALVSIDLIYNLVEGNLSSERQKDISDIEARFRSLADDGGWSARVAKAVCLLEFVRDIPRTEANIAALLVDEVGQPARLAEVQRALKRLLADHFLRETNDGYKLQTAQEKSWDAERRALLNPKQKDRNDIHREIMAEIFADPRLRKHTFKDVRTFEVAVALDGVRLGAEGQLSLCLRSAADERSLPPKVEQARDESRTNAHVNEVFWVFALTPDIHDLVADLHASRAMKTKYEHLQAQRKITDAESACLVQEQQEIPRLRARLKDKLADALCHGQAVFRGTAKEAPDSSGGLYAVLGEVLDEFIPELFPKLELMGHPSLKGAEAEQMLQAANLGALPPVFYGGDRGLDLVVREGAVYTVNASTGIAAEVLGYIRHQAEYGNPVTGRMLEDKFVGPGYGWDRDILLVVLAALIRGGAVVATHQGRALVDYQSPECRAVVTNALAFRAASFAPHNPVGVQTLTAAAARLEDVTGNELATIGERSVVTGFRNLVEEEAKLLDRVKTVVGIERLPAACLVSDYDATLGRIGKAASEGDVAGLLQHSEGLKEARDRMRRLRAALTDSGLGALRDARTAHDWMWPELAARPEAADLVGLAAELGSVLASPDFFDKMERILRLSAEIREAYRSTYEATHSDRFAMYEEAATSVTTSPEWVRVPAHVQGSILAPLRTRACKAGVPQMSDDCTQCVLCRAGIRQMESEIEAIPVILEEAMKRVQESIPEARQVSRVRVCQIVTGPLESDEAVDEAVERLRRYLKKLVAAGASVILE